MISFQNFHTSPRLSQETVAFDARVCWEGRPIGHARNDGGGGMAIFHRDPKAAPADLQAASAFAQAFEFDLDGKKLRCGHLEDYLDHLAGEQAWTDAERKKLARRLKTKTVFVVGANVFELRLAFAGNEQRIRAHLARQSPGAVILNEMPVAAAQDAYIAALRAHEQGA